MKNLIFVCVFIMITLSSIAQDKSTATEIIKKVSAKDVKAIMDTTTSLTNPEIG